MLTAFQLHEDIVLVEAYLQHPGRRYTTPTLRHVQEWAANAILPCEFFAEKAPYSNCQNDLGQRDLSQQLTCCLRWRLEAE